MQKWLQIALFYCLSLASIVFFLKSLPADMPVVRQWHKQTANIVTMRRPQNSGFKILTRAYEDYRNQKASFLLVGNCIAASFPGNAPRVLPKSKNIYDTDILGRLKRTIKQDAHRYNPSDIMLFYGLVQKRKGDPDHEIMTTINELVDVAEKHFPHARVHYIHPDDVIKAARYDPSCSEDGYHLTASGYDQLIESFPELEQYRIGNRPIF